MRFVSHPFSRFSLVSLFQIHYAYEADKPIVQANLRSTRTGAQATVHAMMRQRPRVRRDSIDHHNLSLAEDDDSLLNGSMVPECDVRL